ncbi:hypothetical protein CTI12_AA418150 [Artemisia annua]|uniref:Vacuolar protein-sorting-associated protein 36 n=1 Tax=Artemisia annua TaxID=35608 RepID=A0A2U1M6T1_ARTAN|nr:hypothetical protein CTI12_AA418150 [Artemisia annua]
MNSIDVSAMICFVGVWCDVLIFACIRPVLLKKFESRVMVIQNKSHGDEEVFSRIRSLVQKPDALQSGVSATDAARTLGIAPAMAKEHMLAAVRKADEETIFWGAKDSELGKTR